MDTQNDKSTSRGVNRDPNAIQHAKQNSPEEAQFLALLKSCHLASLVTLGCTAVWIVVAFVRIGSWVRAMFLVSHHCGLTFEEIAQKSRNLYPLLKVGEISSCEVLAARLHSDIALGLKATFCGITIAFFANLTRLRIRRLMSAFATAMRLRKHDTV